MANDKVNVLLVDDQPAKLLAYEVILRDLVQLPHAPERFQQAPHLVFGGVDRFRNVAHARRTEALAPGDQRTYLLPQVFVLRHKPNFVRAKPNPRSLERDFSAPIERADR